MSPNRPNLASVSATVDVAILTLEQDKLKALLVTREESPYAGSLALPGGFLWEGETTLEAAQRLLKGKAGVATSFMEQLYTFDDPKRDPRGRVITVAYYALLPLSHLQLEENEQLHSPSLYDVNNVKELAFDHDNILAYAVARLRSKLAYTNVAYSLLPEKFTFSELQRLYEVILGRTLDKRNFRKKYLSLNLIEPTEEKLVGQRHRPAQLYKFVSTTPAELPEPLL